MMGNVSTFMKKLLDPPKVAPETIEQVEQIVRDSGPSFSTKAALQVSISVAALVEWVLTVVKVHSKSLEFSNL